MPPKCPDGKKGKKQPTKKQPAKSAAKKRGRAAKSVSTAQAASPPRESSPPLTPGRTDQRQTPDSPRSPNPPQPPLNPHTAPRSRRMAATATSSDTSDHGSHRSISNQSGSATSSVTSNISHPGPKKKKKRANRRECHIPQNQEDALVDWVRDHECLWESKQPEYRLTTKKDRLWQEKSEELGFSVNLLQTWFRSLRDIFTKLDKGKSGDGGVMTEREKWTKDSFAFLRKIVRHRPQAAGKSVKAIIAANEGDLSAAEAALAEQGRNADDDDNLDDDVIESSPPPGMPKGKGAKRSACASGEEKALRSLQQRISESGATLEAMRSATLQPVTSRTTFANYVRDSLLSMSDQNFKRARKEMNRLLTFLMDEDDDHSDEAVPSMQPTLDRSPR